MGQELSIESCCMGRESLQTEINSNAVSARDWEDEALASWENLDPITYYEYTQQRSREEEKRHHAMRKRYVQQQRMQHQKPKTYLQEVDDAFDELLGIKEDPEKYEQNYEMATLHKSIKQQEIPVGSYRSVIEPNISDARSPKEAEKSAKLTKSQAIVTVSSSSSSSSCFKPPNDFDGISNG